MLVTFSEELQKLKGDSRLKDYVLNHLIEKINEDGNIKEYMDNILTYGCISGCVPELIYYSDILAVYEDHKNEINDLLAELMEESGYTYKEKNFFKNWDETDPLCLQMNNRQILVWFAFESIISQIADEIS